MASHHSQSKMAEMKLAGSSNQPYWALINALIHAAGTDWTRVDLTNVLTDFVQPAVTQAGLEALRHAHISSADGDIISEECTEEPNTANEADNVDSSVYWSSGAPIPAAMRDRENYYTTGASALLKTSSVTASTAANRRGRRGGVSEKDVPTSAVFVKSLPVRKMASELRTLFWN